jgi:hypothetical protein
MPMRKGPNGGWQRVSRQKMNDEQEEELVKQQQQDEQQRMLSAGIQVHNAQTYLDDDRLTNTSAEADQQQSVEADWAVEARRRVRYDQVQRNMTYLTGIAAIGGFLFGYDTGKNHPRSYMNLHINSQFFGTQLG